MIPQKSTGGASHIPSRDRQMPSSSLAPASCTSSATNSAMPAALSPHSIRTRHTGRKSASSHGRPLSIWRRGLVALDVSAIECSCRCDGPRGRLASGALMVDGTVRGLAGRRGGAGGEEFRAPYFTFEYEHCPPRRMACTPRQE
eukprot:scaffold27268_cov110-Isochrysis_galbana.AAC.5